MAVLGARMGPFFGVSTDLTVPGRHSVASRGCSSFAGRELLKQGREADLFPVCLGRGLGGGKG